MTLWSHDELTLAEKAGRDGPSRKNRKRIPYKDRESAATIFWSFVQQNGPDECWPWQRTCNGQGYGSFWFEFDGVRKNYGAHVIACVLTHGGKPTSKGTAVMHSCDNPPCCNPAHLRVGTASENLADMRAKGRRDTSGYARGERHVNAKLTEANVREIRRRRASGDAWKRIAKAYGLRPYAVQQLVHYKTWKHVDPDGPRPVPMKRAVVLNEGTVRAIKLALAAGVSQAALAVRYGTAQTNISFIARGKTWAHVT